MALRRAVFGISLSLACTLPAVVARTSSAQDTGTIVGHVYGADTNAPIRIGNVLLRIAPVGKRAHGDKAGGENGQASAAQADLYLDGSFSFAHVKPGRYSLYASAPGYLSAFNGEGTGAASSTGDAGQSTDRTTAANPVMVELGPNQTVRVDFELERGAAVEGQVLFDDGSPVAAILVKALKKASDGKWKEVQVGPGTGIFGPVTDDRGHYRISGLGAGEYLIEADVGMAPDNVMDTSVMEETRFSYMTRAVYSGNVFERKDATPFKLTRGEELAGEDLTFRASALHRVSGVVVAREDGHPIPDAKVEIDAADGGVVEAVHVLDASGTFQFEFVPEGRYTLKVSGARDVNAEGKTEREYGIAQQPLILENDTTGLVIAVPAGK
ncbi:MAG: carboxypeptidase regulatory-like domain-containing protein [Acidobacteriaceae bacterium]